MRHRTPSLLVLTIGLGLLAAGCSSGNVFELAVGDCFDTDAGTAEVRDVAIVDCAEPHDNEVFHAFEVEDGDYPGDQELVRLAREECIPAFASHVGAAADDGDLDAFPITPSASGWESGDREIVCALHHVDGDKLTAPARSDTGR